MARDGEGHYRAILPVLGSTFGDSLRAKILRLHGVLEHELRHFGGGMRPFRSKSTRAYIIVGVVVED